MTRFDVRPSWQHSQFCRNPLHPGPCKRVFDRLKGRKKKPVTGHFTFGRSKWWDQIPPADDEDGIPVENLTVQFTRRDYHIAHGTAYRVDGVVYLVEHDPSDRSTTNGHQAVSAVHQFHHAKIAPHDEGYQKAYLILERPAPYEEDKRKAGTLAPGKHIAGAAGDGSTQVFGYTMDYFRPGDLPPILAHEYGHNVGLNAPPVADSNGDLVRIDDSARWQDAGRADAARGGPQSRVTGAQIDPGDTAARKWFGSLNAGVRPDLPYPVGVTPYGGTSQREDFAESVMIYMAGSIATGFPMDGVDAVTDHEVPIYFRDFYPHRAAELDALFPAFARAQQQQISRERS